MRLRTFLGVIMAAVLLSIGLASISGCATTVTQTAPVIQPASTLAVVQTTAVTTVTTPATIMPVTAPAVVTTVTAPAPITTTESQQILLAGIRSTDVQPYGGVYYVNAVTAKNLVDQTQAIFLDARWKVDYDVSHISGAISLPVSSIWAGTIDPETILLDKEAIIIAYCAPGCPAGLELAEELYVRGYQNVFVLDGGYLVWQDAGYAMVTQTVKP
jgi:rhodanese-related sulfurtransferase